MGRVVARADVFSATAARMSAFNAFSLILSPSWKSMARLVLPSRLALPITDRKASSPDERDEIRATLMPHRSAACRGSGRHKNFGAYVTLAASRSS